MTATASPSAATRSSKRSLARMRAVSRDVFGFDELREGQEAIVSSVLDGHHTLAVMPTGAGKSLCYQLLALELRGITLVVSPLISLMKDQHDKLLAAGIDAVSLNSALPAAVQRDALERIARANAAKPLIVFVTPERLTDSTFVDAVARTGVLSLLVVDEAHCVSQWGHDFRPAFLAIADAARALGGPPLLAMTATATAHVIGDILRALAMRDPRVVHVGVYRHNLRLAVVQVGTRNKDARLLALLRERRGPGIVYCATVKACNAVAARLDAEQIPHVRYHGRMNGRERADAQERFMTGACGLMIATNAFGMGIDKPDVRFVVHYQMPGSLDAYYQEAGRAGRDDEPADCVLLFDLKDRQVQQFFLIGRYPDAPTIRRVFDALRDALSEPATSRDADASGRTGTSMAARLKRALPDVAANKIATALQMLRTNGLATRTRHGRYRINADERADERIEEAARNYREIAQHDRDMLETMIGYAHSAACRWHVLLDYFDPRRSDDTDDALRPADVVTSEPGAAILRNGRCGVCDNCVHPPTVDVKPAQGLAPQQPAGGRAKPRPRVKPGEFARVRRYGVGRVVLATEEQVALLFGDGATRTFVARAVKPAQAPAPLEPAHDQAQ